MFSGDLNQVSLSENPLDESGSDCFVPSENFSAEEPSIEVGLDSLLPVIGTPYASSYMYILFPRM